MKEPAYFTSLSRLWAWQGETDAGAGGRLWVYPHTPAMGFDNGFGEIESEPCAFRFTDSLVGAIETVENVGDVGGVDTWPLVTNAYDDLPRPNLSTDANLASRGIFDGVGNQVGKHLSDAVFISQDDGKFCGEIHQDGMMLSLCSETLCQSPGQGRH